MLLTIHNLPATTRYADIKSLLQTKCGLQHVILDNLIGESGGKKVTVGVAEDADAAILVRKINGLYWNGQQLYVEDVRQQKTSADQPFRSMNSQPQEPTDSTFRSMNLQQHSSYSNKGLGMATNMMAPAVQPMMTAMYYVPSYSNQDYMQAIGNMQGGNFLQSQNYDHSAEKVQSAYMGISGYSQTSTQMSQVGMVPQFNKNQNFSQSDSQNSGWGENYNEGVDFAAEKPLYGRRSPAKNCGPKWFSNQDRQRESPPRERANNREPSWNAPRGSDTRGPRPVQPDFRSNKPDGHSEFKRPRLDLRQNNRPALLEKPIRPGFVSNAKGQIQFSGKLNEFSGRPNQRQERPIERDGFSERSNEFGRSNERPDPNKFSGRPNEFSGRSDKFSERPNEFSGRLNERQRRPDEQQGKLNEFNDRKGRPNDRTDFNRSNQREEFNRSYGRRDEVSESNDRFSRRGPNQRDTRPERENARPEIPDSKKRKFEERFQEKPIERPLRVSRPNMRARPLWQANPSSSGSFSKPNEQSKPMTEVETEKLNRQMVLAGVRRTIYEMKCNLGVEDPDLITRQMFNKFIFGRLDPLLGGRTSVTPIECYQLYRTTYPECDDVVAFNSILEMVAQKKANETNSVQPEATAAPVPKPFAFQQPVPPKLTKGELKAKRKLKEAKHLLSQGKVPTFPQGNKSIVAKQRKEDKEGFIPEVEVLYKTAIEEEVDALNELLVKELRNPPSQNAQKVYDSVNQAHLCNEMKHTLTQSLSRRVLDSGLKVVRIYGHPKLPKREIIEKFLLKFGVQSLRKSTKAKLYTAAVDTYRNHDRLCAKQPVTVADGNTLTFKPFHIALKPKTNQRVLKTIRKKNIQDMIDESDLNLLDKNWPVKEVEIQEKQKLEAEAKALEFEALEAQKLAEEAEKRSEEELKKSENPITNDGEIDLTAKNDPGNVSNEYLNDDFHVIDEVHENDSDVEFITETPSEIVRIDEENDDVDENKIEENNEENVVEVNKVEEVVEQDVVVEKVVENDVEDDDMEENDVELAYKAFEKSQSANTDVALDNIDVDIDDVDDDDLEDY